MLPTQDVIGALTAAGRPLAGAGDDYDYFLELIGDARLALLGEAAHGIHEFYRSERRSRNV